MFESKYKEPLCPCCNVELEHDDTYDMEYDSEGITLYIVGYCPCCERNYRWQTSGAIVRWANTDLREI